jgi:hypothetical protein
MGTTSQGATGAGLLVSVSDRSFFDSFKEAGSLAKHLAGGRRRKRVDPELSSERGTGFGAKSSREEIESGTIDALTAAVKILEAKAPDELNAYRSFVLEVAEKVGKAAGGGDEAEAAAIEKIRAALAELIR